jgi:uncharacterized protein YbcC (UPF0753/DUF2309 family)
MTIDTNRRDTLRRNIAAAARLLPAQGPIGAFVARNPLEGFEDRSFEMAVEAAADLYGAEPYLPESAYREALATGRIRPTDVEAVLAETLGAAAHAPLAGGRVRLVDVLRVLLLVGLRHESDATVRWTLTESDVIERLRGDLDQACRARLLATVDPRLTGRAAERAAASDLWHACVEATASGRAAVSHRRPPVRPRDLVVAVRPALDLDERVHPTLIRVVAAYLDQGVADWPLPDRDRGLLAAAAGLFATLAPQEPWAAGLRDRFTAIASRCRAVADPDAVALDVIAEELDALAIPPASWEEMLARSALALQGWAGMVRQLEERPDLAPLVRVPVSLAGFLAVRLVLDRAAAGWAACHLTGRRQRAGGQPDLAGLWAELGDRQPPVRGPGTLSRALLLHQLAQLLGLAAADLRGLDTADVAGLEATIHACDSVTRRRLLHLSYERRFTGVVLDALVALPAPSAARGTPRAQVVCCIDDRCESWRRHLEELAPDVATFGAAGFFAVAMNYRGIDDWHATPLCPIVVRPAHTVTEVPEEDDRSWHHSRQRVRRRLGALCGLAAAGTRSLLAGGLLTSVGGAVAAVPLVARVVFPRLTAILSRSASRWRPVRTRLALARTSAGRLPDGTLPGFDITEMAGVVRRLLEDIGLTGGFARLVVLLGHGSSSLNNPHESAYDCGACGGGRGGPNARAFALMANDPAVRARLAADGLVIPADTAFLGGMLDTCSERIEWYDVERLPAAHRADVAALQRDCDAARARDALERCRRFDGVPLGILPADALRAVEARAADLAQVRPEYGHASTALCIVGRRDRTRGLFLDRRAFLVSYDPGVDPDDAILTRTLAAVGPVASGISLAYTFSRIDPLRYGAGTKLPHNITGLIGVMDGHAGDLRTGLPLQGVEIHEPVRLTVIVETTPTRLVRVLAALPAVNRMVRHGWVKTVCWPPDGGPPQVYEPADDRFVAHVVEQAALPVVASSADWFRGTRDHLPPALVRPPERVPEPAR